MPEKSKEDRLVALRLGKMVLKEIWHRKPYYTENQQGNPVTAIFCGLDASEQHRRTYIKLMTGEEGNLAFLRNRLLGGRNAGEKLVLTAMVLWALPLLTGICLWSRRRVNWALLLKSGVELANTMMVLRDHGIAELYVFNIFDIDTNILAWLAQKRGVRVTKICSDVPLGYLNKTILAHRLATCIQYQAEEAARYPEIRVKEIVNWMPEHYFLYIDNYDLPRQYETPRQTLGFYSSASWLRQELGHADLGENFAKAENELCLWIKAYAEKHPETQVIIFPHPYEKRSEAIYARTMDYYRALYGGVSLQFNAREAATTKTFDHVDVAISVVSTVSYERLFMGFKSLFFIYQDGPFPLPGSKMDNICTRPNASFLEKVEESLRQTRREFFDKNGLKGYSVEDFGHKFAG